MISVNDIAQEIQTQLGINFKLWVDNNTPMFEIAQGTTFEKAAKEQDDYIHALMTTTQGEIVALNGLFSTSFGYAIEFYTPTNINIEGTLDTLISTLNGTLNTVGTDKYLITFNSPTAVGRVDIDNGVYKQLIRLDGNIAITDFSIFGNEYDILIDAVSVKDSLINANVGLSLQTNDPATTDNSLVPQMENNLANSDINLTLHLRKDNPITNTLIGYYLNCDTLINKDFQLTQTILANTSIWVALLSSLNIDFSLGGYAIATLSFTRKQVIT